jgi:hypothetical protein
MANRVFVCAVVVLWLGSMSWLMVDKILPSFHGGEPPMAAGYDPGVPIAWRVSWGGRQVGHAASIRVPGPMGTTNLESRVVLEDVPLLDLVPALMRHVVGDIGSMKLDAETRLEFDSLDNFSRFESKVAVNDVPSILRILGQMHGSFLELKVTFGNMTYSPKVPVTDKAALSEALFPDAKLPYMYIGRRWSEEVYNPFRSPRTPVETVDVEVTGIEQIEHGDENVKCMRVEFRGPPAPGVPEDARLQAVAWVRSDDGLVLRQDVIISSSKLRFERLPENEAGEVGRTLLVRPSFERRRGRGAGNYGQGWQAAREVRFVVMNGLSATPVFVWPQGRGRPVVGVPPGH